MKRLEAFWQQPVGAGPLASFRVLYGLIMFWEVTRYFQKGWIQRYYAEPDFQFKYMGFEWVEPMSGPALNALFVLLGIVALMVAAGVFYRACMTILLFGWTYVFLLEESNYLNHMYFVLLLTFVMIFVDANRAVAFRSSDKLRAWVPRWHLALIQFQVGLVYFFGGIAKLQKDWLSGYPLTAWVAGRFAPDEFFGIFHMEHTGLIMSWAALVFDLAIVFVLLNKKVRPVGIALVLGFNLMNAYQFSIGIFPWVMIGSLVLFMDPENVVFTKLGVKSDVPERSEPPASAVKAALAAWAVIMCLIPLRHWLYPGNVNWTEEGHRFSWRMKLRDKQTRAVFYAKLKDSELSREINWLEYLTPRQYAKMLNSPPRVIRFAKYVRDQHKKEGFDVEVRGVVATSLNRRVPQLVFDPEADLASYELSLFHVDYIRPFEDTEPGQLREFVQELQDEANIE